MELQRFTGHMCGWRVQLGQMLLFPYPVLPLALDASANIVAIYWKVLTTWLENQPQNV